MYWNSDSASAVRPRDSRNETAYMEYILAQYATILLEQHVNDPKYSETLRADLLAAASYGYRIIAKFEDAKIKL